MLFFKNKTQRAEEKVFAEIANKIKKSKQVQKKSVGNDEMYCFDDTDVVFNTVKGTLTVKKDDEVLVSFDCNWDAYDKNAQIRSVHFSGLLEKARNAFAKQETKKETLQKATEKVQAQANAEKVKRQEQQTKEAILQNALDKLRGE